MQRVSAFLPSWDKRTSSNNSNSNANANASVNSANQPNHTARTASAGGSFFGWSNRSSAASSSRASVLHNLTKINVNQANRRASKTGSLVNGGSPRFQREAFWPAPLDHECEKAARIIKSFCADGYLAAVNDPTTPPPTDEPKTPIRIPKKIPKRIIQNAAGIAVFTCMRSGLWMTGSGGSGILIARKSDGTWSPPSGIMLHTPSLSFIMGVDVYDCVLVVNTLEALESITRPRVVLGEDVGLTSGPLVPLDIPDSEVDINLRDLGSTVLTYVKSRGQEQMVNMNGCILTERANENERFYEAAVSQMDVLSGNVSRHVDETRPLSEIIKLAEGRSDFDPAIVGKIAIEPAPGDANIASPNATPQSPRSAFGVPQAHDPDPFGVLALEMAGMEIREAGTRLRPTSSQLDFHPRPISATSSKNFRQSGQTFMSKSNRESVMSNRTVKSRMSDAHTQTDTANTPQTSPSPGRSEDGQQRTSLERNKDAKKSNEEEEVDYTTVDTTPLKHLSSPPPEEESFSTPELATTPVKKDVKKMDETDTTTQLAVPSQDDEIDRRSKASSHYGDDDDRLASSDDSSDDNADDEDDMSDEEPVVFEVAAVQQQSTQAVASRMIHARGNMVTIPKRIPPPLPTRNPARASMQSRLSADAVSVQSPLRQKFSDSELNGEATDSRRTSALSKRSSISTQGLAAQTPLPEDSDDEQPEVRSSKVDTPQIVEPSSPKHDSAEFQNAMSVSTDVKETASPAQRKSIDSSVSDVKQDDSGLPEESKKEDGVPQQPEEPATPAPAHKEDATFIVTPPAEDQTESNDKARVSIETGGTDARSSFENSSYTTPPTSERHFSGDEEDIDTTPTKPKKTFEKASEGKDASATTVAA